MAKINFPNQRYDFPSAASREPGFLISRARPARRKGDGLEELTQGARRQGFERVPITPGRFFGDCVVAEQSISITIATKGHNVEGGDGKCRRADAGGCWRQTAMYRNHFGFISQVLGSIYISCVWSMGSPWDKARKRL